MASCLEDLGLGSDSTMLSRLETYVDEIGLFNPAYHLVSYSTTEELVVRHIADCASGLPVIRSCIDSRSSVADFGSGAGLPGIVLAILMPDVHFTLVERMKRRVDFLRNAVTVCNLDNVEVVNRDISEIDTRFPFVTFRAFRPLDQIIGDVDRLLEPDGCVCAYKGQRRKAEEEARMLPAWQSDYIPLTVPHLDEERGMLVMRRKGGME